jgi:hypothetical protein
MIGAELESAVVTLETESRVVVIDGLSPYKEKGSGVEIS